MRKYTLGPKDPAQPTENDKDPIDVALKKALEHNHAQTTSKTPKTQPVVTDTANGSKALVPLNIIYLPPPHWHQPLQLPGKGREPKLHNVDTINSNGRSRVKTADQKLDKPGNSFANDDTYKPSDGAQPSFEKPQGIFQRLRCIFAKASSKPLDSANSESQQKEDNNHAEAMSRLTAEKWQESMVYRLLISSRHKVDALRALPKDDDWVTWLGKALNKLTGYDRIAELKTKVETSGAEFHKARQQLEEIKSRHANALKERINSQREINGLLQRKHLWNEDDVARFTSLYRQEHMSETVEQNVGKEVQAAESLADQKYDELVNSIRERYHEEQIWSDKIRRASTYGTWAVLFMNVFALLMAQAIFEPRKRRKIVDGVDERLAAVLDEQQVKAGNENKILEQRLVSHEKVTKSVVEHLSTMSAVLGAIAARQESEISALSAQLLGDSTSSRQPVVTIDPAAMVSSGHGYSDTELDMYYEQQQQQQREKHKDAQEKVYTKNQARQMALETATVTSLIIGMIAYYFAI
ncbi:sensitivity to high expression protein she9 [Coemansia spiralis]|uniref:Sensitive to high expression protein 9, mitochondrial n=2 Tax=Coemansia TaxID=4863 RepID=A0A9W8KXE8_9FUNG|nr:sensitivity to high expression protein she9 [Coemansia umbellata]KAJ2674994.1 sensitivity to high expression protein she9 [Coemansia spiralis]